MLSERRLCFDPDSAAIEQNQTHLQLQSLHLSYGDVCTRPRHTHHERVAPEPEPKGSGVELD